jgi:hypothetical protein
MRYLLVLLIGAQAHADVTQKAGYKCSDGKTQIAISIQGPNLYYDDLPLWKVLKDSKHTIKISSAGKDLVYDKNVVMSADGAGEESFMVLQPGTLEALETLVNFYVEHEGEYLVGGFRLEEGKWVKFMGESMRCEAD